KRNSECSESFMRSPLTLKPTNHWKHSSKTPSTPPQLTLSAFRRRKKNGLILAFSDNVMTTVKKVDIEKDINIWIQMNKKESEPPVIPHYHSFDVSHFIELS